MITRNLHFPLLSSFLFCQNRLSRFSTKTHIVEQPQACEDHISVIYTHARLLKLGFANDTSTTHQLMNGYVRLGRIEQAHQLFDETPEPDVATSTSLMAGYTKTSRPKVALRLFGGVAFSSVQPNAFTLATIVKVCLMLAAPKIGRRIHAQVEIFGLQSDLVVCSSLIDVSGKCNDVDEARRVFDLMGCTYIVSWTSFITAYAQNGRAHNALEVFREFNLGSSQSFYAGQCDQCLCKLRQAGDWESRTWSCGSGEHDSDD